MGTQVVMYSRNGVDVGWGGITLFFCYLSFRAQQQNINIDHVKIYCSPVFEKKIRENLN